MSFNVGFMTMTRGAFVSQVHAPNTLHAEICAVRLRLKHGYNFWIEDEDTGDVYWPDENLVAAAEQYLLQKRVSAPTEAA